MPLSETGRSLQVRQSRLVLAPSRSWTSATSTTTTMTRPKVSVTMTRFLAWSPTAGRLPRPSAEPIRVQWRASNTGAIMFAWHTVARTGGRCG